MYTILIVDDDAAIGDLEQEVLTRAGYAVVRAYSGTEALLAMKDRRPDLILLDLMLPGLSGEELLPQIRDIPVIVVSAKAAVQDKVELLLGGAADYLTKPFDTQELLARALCQPATRQADGIHPTILLLQYRGRKMRGMQGSRIRNHRDAVYG